MKLSDTSSIALRAIGTNKSRSLLTMLGIIIGVGSVVLMTAIGASVEELILGQVSSLGANSMVIFPGVEEGGGSQQRPGFDSLTMDDVNALEHLSTVTTIAPVIFVNGNVSYGREKTTPQVMGSKPTFYKNQSITIDRGRMLDEADEVGARYALMLGPDTADELFGDNDPLGKRITVGDRFFTVVGITKALGTQFFQNADERVYMPFSTAKIMTGQKYVHYITMTSTGDTDLAFADIKSLLRSRHRIRNPNEDPDKDDFVVRSAAQATDILGAVSLGLTLFLSAIAGISLVVGGIGIMNIMLVAVTERTREIGLRKAVGARKRDILLQFLIESVLLTLIGGLIGIVGGVGLAFLISLVAKNFLAGYLFALSPSAIFLSVIVAAGTGLLFGMYPARRAANLNPIEALRYE
ncbi:MAG: ABC transporter permease [Patescibacteria group bacterium]